MSASGEISKPHLTVLLGAGASVPVGLPSTSELTTLVEAALMQPDERFVDVEGHRSAVGVLLEAARRYYDARVLTFEHLLDLLEGAAALQVAWKPGNAPTVAEACFAVADPRWARVFEGDFIHDCIHQLTSTVLYTVRDRTAAVRQSEHWHSYRSFWRRIAETFTVTIGTLNYDTSLEQALDLGPEAQGLARVDGENVWRLDLPVLKQPASGHRLLHLHGGVHLGDREYGAERNRFSYLDQFHELYWHPTVEGAFATRWGHCPPTSQSGRTLEGGRIVTGLNKPDKLLVEPLAAYYQEFGNQIGRCGRLLVVGYGFNDPHINALISRMNRLHGQHRRIGVLDVVDPVQEHGSTARHVMLETLHRWAEHSCIVDPDRRPYPLVSPNGKVMFYWNGLMQAAGAVEDLIRFLAA